MSRPDWVKCIADDRIGNRAWCGNVLTGFHFVNIEHAAIYGANGGRLVACRQCVDKIVEGLRAGDSDD